MKRLFVIPSAVLFLIPFLLLGASLGRNAVPHQQLIKQAVVTSDANGNATFKFEGTPASLVWTGTLAILQAPAAAKSLVTVGQDSAVGGTPGISLGYFNGPGPYGPVQALGGQVIVIQTSGLTANTSFTAMYVGASDDEGSVPFVFPSSVQAPSSVTLPSGTVYGSGVDGSFTLDGVAVPPWATLAGSVYTMTRDAQLINLTVNGGITLLPTGYRLVGTGTLTNNGTIQANGITATLIAGGVGATQHEFGSAAAGGAGGNNGGAPANGGSVASPGIGAPGGKGGNSGAGGGGGGGGTGGSIVTGPPFLGTSLGGVPNFIALSAGNGGGGGATGAVGGTSGGGGGGGGGGLAIAFPTIVNNGVISANGGNGAPGQAGNGGGGGGGAGGWVYVICTTYSGALPTATAGSGGAGLGTGTAGLSGTNGYVGVAQNVT